MYLKCKMGITTRVGLDFLFGYLVCKSIGNQASKSEEKYQAQPLNTIFTCDVGCLRNFPAAFCSAQKNM